MILNLPNNMTTALLIYAGVSLIVTALLICGSNRYKHVSYLRWLSKQAELKAQAHAQHTASIFNGPAVYRSSRTQTQRLN